MMYRRTVDNAYTPMATLRRAIEDADTLAALEPRLGGLADAIVTQDAKTAMATIKTAESAVGKGPRPVNCAPPIESAAGLARQKPGPGESAKAVDQSAQLV